MSAAFDKCWHKGILAKLKQAKVDGTSLDLFTSYLENRKQCTIVDNTKSKMKNVTAGVPQGSKLGPLLYSYCNDVVVVVVYCLKYKVHNCKITVSLFLQLELVYVSAFFPWPSPCPNLVAGWMIQFLAQTASRMGLSHHSSRMTS